VKFSYMKPVFFVSGYCQAGKDTLAGILVKEHGFKRFAFADGIRALLLEIDPYVQVRAGRHSVDPWVYMRLSELFKKCSQDWELVKNLCDEIRTLFQRTGHGGRRVFGPELWAHRTRRLVEDWLIEMMKRGHWDNVGGVVISDYRMPHESYAFMHSGYTDIQDFLDPMLAWIERPGKGKINEADSEQHYEKLKQQAEYKIINSASIEELKQTAQHMVDYAANKNNERDSLNSFAHLDGSTQSDVTIRLTNQFDGPPELSRVWAQFRRRNGH